MLSNPMNFHKPLYTHNRLVQAQPAPEGFSHWFSSVCGATRWRRVSGYLFAFTAVWLWRHYSVGCGLLQALRAHEMLFYCTAEGSPESLLQSTVGAVLTVILIRMAHSLHRSLRRPPP
eukprot:gnl/TRDRNA2_/TRDRNA2_76203_c0_seq1.p1 gnl/TRDRNA2_/TRDRNA2_76203_c0~~gnl/TRDRNA2_/TRDRNA2_76203_c0_seq1.p1  ORF type:complete len:118 (+),score=2.45 gnl/TRDRNA2_/TRDRNA2_76203_c0_seq1:69-422(+)